MTKIGERVTAIFNVENDVVRSFGDGVYVGDEIPSQDIGGFNTGFPNPKIVLDNGKVVWGCECWWGTVEGVKKKFIGDRKVEIVDIDVVREDRKKQ
jgi:hypothetical protein